MSDSIKEKLTALGYSNTEIEDFLKYYNYAIDHSYKYPLEYAMLKITI